MIVGANGCGKTTVIECLKMACTGRCLKSGHTWLGNTHTTNTVTHTSYTHFHSTHQSLTGLLLLASGSLPPSVAQGQSFVNDPSMTNSSEVKAHIKLRFNNKSGQPTVVARLYQV